MTVILILTVRVTTLVKRTEDVRIRKDKPRRETLDFLEPSWTVVRLELVCMVSVVQRDGVRR